MADDDSRDDRATTAIDGGELRKLVEAARAETAETRLSAEIAEHDSKARPTEAVAPIVMIVDRPLKVVDGAVQSKEGRAAKLKTVSKFRALSAAATVADSLDAALARGSGLATAADDDEPGVHDTAMDPPPATAFAPPPAEAATVTAAAATRRDGLISLEEGLVPLGVDTAASTRALAKAARPRARARVARGPSGVAVARRGIDGYVLAALAIVVAGVLFIAFS